MTKNNKYKLFTELTSNKSKRVSLVFNEKFWDLFKTACEMDNVKMTNKIEEWAIEYIDSKGLLKSE